MPAQAWVTLIVGFAATIGVIVTWRQKQTADRRAEWWRRLSWAFDHSLSLDQDESDFGWLMIEHLAMSKLATRTDEEFFQAVAERWINGDNDSGSSMTSEGGLR